MPERVEVTVRLLPAGNFLHGFQCNFEGDLLRVDLDSPGRAAGLQAGSLVEVESEQAIYMGEVYGQEGTRLVIGVEHIVDRKALAVIQNVWSPPDRH